MTDPRIARALEVALERGEVGVQVAAYLDGELIVEAAAGVADEAGTPVGLDTLFPILSAGKAVPAVATHLQAERGLVEYDAPVARYWPEYGAAGKEGITLEQVLSHRAGVPQLPEGTTVDDMCDWDLMTTRVAELKPLYPPGTTNSYHALSFGWILGEVVRRTDPEGRPFGRFVQEEICGPLTIEDLWIGVPEDRDDRCATITSRGYVAAPADRAPAQALAVPQSIGRPQVFQNRSDFRRACVPAGNANATARSLARLYAMLAGRGALDGVRLLSAERVERLTVPRDDFSGNDMALGGPRPYGVGGFALGGETVYDGVLGDGTVIWHHGGGGTYAWADLDAGLAVAICHNSLFAAPPDPADNPFTPLGEAVRAVAADVAAGRSIATTTSTD